MMPDFTIPVYLKTGFKILVSIAIVFLLARNIDWNEFVEILKSLKPTYLLLAIICFILSKWISSERFRCLLNAHDKQYSQQKNLKLYWKGMYYNLLLPGGISGDAYKIKVLNTELGLSLPSLIKLALTDRFSGMFALIQLGAALMLFIPAFSAYRIWIFIGLLLSCVLPIYLLKYVQHIYKHLNFKLFFYSIGVQSFQLVSALGIIYAIAQESQLLAYLILFLVSSLAAMIPITIGGAGARELCFYYGAPIVNGSAEEAVAIGFIFYLISTIVSFAGIALVFKNDSKS